MSAALRVGQRVREAAPGDTDGPLAGVVRRVRRYVPVDIVDVQWDDGGRVGDPITTESELDLVVIEKVERPTRFTIRRVSVGSKSNLPWCTYDTERPSWIGRSRSWSEAMATYIPGVYAELRPSTDEWVKLADELDGIPAAPVHEFRRGSLWSMTTATEHIEPTA